MIRSHYLAAFPFAIAALFGAWLAAAAPADESRVLYQPPPDWVRECDWSAATNWTRNEKSEGTRYLLYESQERANPAGEFTRVILLMENETGVQDSGSLTFSFDPAYQQLLLHRVLVHRDGKSIERLDKTKVRIIQPEPGLDGHLITGHHTALLFVEDLRVGDALEYAYTISGANPVLAGHYATRFVFQSGTPVERQLFRVVWNSPDPLPFRVHLRELQPFISLCPGGREYTWHFTNLAAIPFEDCQPAAYEPCPYIECSDFPDWASVVNWALPLYAAAPGNVPQELHELIARWQQSASSSAEQARLALQFVQDELRYTALELGPDSFRPADPVETFQKRYGDCKGKAALLCFLLRSMELEAYPALVNSAYRESIAGRLPSPFAFNHVIVKLILEGKPVWVDPTRSHQGGSLWNRYLPPLGKALVIRAGTDALEDLPVPRPENASVQETRCELEVRKYQSPVPFRVSTVYRGVRADDMREEIASRDLNELLQDYLNFYARSYPGIATNQPLTIADDRAANILTITESYVITNVWEFNEDNQRWELDLYADSIQETLTDPNTRIRQTPIGLRYPLKRKHEILVHLPDTDWNIPPLRKQVEHAGFSFQYRRAFSGSTARFEYEYESKLATVPTASVPEYLAKLDDTLELLSDTLQRPGTEGGQNVADLNWLMVIIALFATGGTVTGLTWYWRRSIAAPAAETNVPPEIWTVDTQLQGLGGWLILVGIGLGLSAVLRVVQIGQSWEGFFSNEVWQTMAMPRGSSYHPLFGPLLIYELLGNTILLGLNLLAIGLFFARRRAFPPVYIAWVLLSVLFILMDQIGCLQVPSLREDGATVKAAGACLRAVIFGAIWTSYMLTSRRVKATFVK